MQQIQLTTEALANPLLRKECPVGTGQIYKFVPLYRTKSKGYIGRNQTTLLKRIHGHKTPNSECVGLRNAIKRHGLDKFAIVVLQDNIPIAELAEAELRWIALHDTYNQGYNATPGGETPPMTVPSIVAKAKATKNTDASKALLSASLKAHLSDPTKHARHAASLAMSRRTSEVRQKSSESARRLWQKPGYKERLKNIQKISQNRPEQKAKLSQKSIEMHKDPAFQQRRAEAIRRALARKKELTGSVRGMRVAHT